MRHFRILIILLTISLSLLYCQSFAQKGGGVEYSTKSRKAKKAMDRAMSFFSVHNDEDAIIEAKQAVDIDSNFVEAYLLLGQIYENKHQIQKCIFYYRKASKVDPDFYPMVFYILGSHELEFGEYEYALEDFRTYLQHPKMDKRLSKVLNENIDRAYFGIDHIKHPVKYEPTNLGPAINTPAEEYVNTISTDGQTLIFTRKYNRNPSTSNRRFLYQCKREKWKLGKCYSTR